MYRYLNAINEKRGLELEDYDDLYRWSVDNIADFWASVWDFVGVTTSSGYDRVVDDPGKMPGASSARRRSPSISLRPRRNTTSQSTT
jgi:acetoacetyl-CoA synthetase